MTERRWVDGTRGAGALVGVLVLAVGVPALLIAWVGWPLPTELPTLDEVSTALSTSDISDGFLIKTLAVVCWLVWIELMASLIVEAVAHARGREAGRVPFGGGLQRAAARMIATVALLGALTTAKGAPEAAELVLDPLRQNFPTPAFVMADDEEPTSTPAADGESAGQDAEAGTQTHQLPVYEVKWRDTLWGIAETHLHDPFRWTEIFEMNKEKPQGDGRVLSDPDLIHPGWRLELPADAVGLEIPAAAQPDSQPEPVPDVDDGPDDELDPEPGGGDDGSDGGSGGDDGSGGAGDDAGGVAGRQPDPGGMILIDDLPPPATPEYAAPQGLVRLPDDFDAEPPEAPATGVPIPGLGQGELAAPGGQPRRRTLSHEWTDDDREP